MASQHFSDEVIKVWNGYEVRVMVLLSFLLQTILVTFGSQRKYRRGIWINLIVWLAYMTADWVATVALGILARSQGHFEANSLQSSSVIQAFWAPFLLLHLGGPDTITAYSLEDNELWLRHLLGLVIQVGVAFYIFIRSSWHKNTALGFLFIPIFITGVIKYGERTFALRSSSAKKFKDSLFSSLPTPAPARGPVSNDERNNPKNYLVEANLLFQKFRFLFANLDVQFDLSAHSIRAMFIRKSATEAFKLVAIELGFMYDLLYTKATMIFSRFGIFLRCLCFFSHVSVLVVFSLIVDKHPFSSIDISITYVLVLGAVFLEVYSFTLLLFSDWAKLLLTKLRNGLSWLTKCNFIYNVLLSSNSGRWSSSMGQYNLLSLCLKRISSKSTRVPKLFGIEEVLEKYQHITWEDVNVVLQNKIFNMVREKVIKVDLEIFAVKRVLGESGIGELQWCLENSISIELRSRAGSIAQIIGEQGFGCVVLIWHIAIDVCYSLDYGDSAEVPIKDRISKWLSNYMLYIIVICPSMLRERIDERRYKESCAEVVRFFEGHSNIRKEEACRMLIGESIIDELRNSRDEGHQSLSVLYYGRVVAESLQDLKSNRGEDIWTTISEASVNMLIYAASHSEWKEHGQQLIKGGELLTHVCVLMTHMGLSDQYI